MASMASMASGKRLRRRADGPGSSKHHSAAHATEGAANSEHHFRLNLRVVVELLLSCCSRLLNVQDALVTEVTETLTSLWGTPIDFRIWVRHGPYAQVSLDVTCRQNWKCQSAMSFRKAFEATFE